MADDRELAEATAPLSFAEFFGPHERPSGSRPCSKHQKVRHFCKVQILLEVVCYTNTDGEGVVE